MASDFSVFWPCSIADLFSFICLENEDKALPPTLPHQPTNQTKNPNKKTTKKPTHQ